MTKQLVPGFLTFVSHGYGKLTINLTNFTTDLNCTVGLAIVRLC